MTDHLLSTSNTEYIQDRSVILNRKSPYRTRYWQTWHRRLNRRSVNTRSSDATESTRRHATVSGRATLSHTGRGVASTAAEQARLDRLYRQRSPGSRPPPHQQGPHMSQHPWHLDAIATPLNPLSLSLKHLGSMTCTRWRNLTGGPFVYLQQSVFLTAAANFKLHPIFTVVICMFHELMMWCRTTLCALLQLHITNTITTGAALQIFWLGSKVSGSGDGIPPMGPGRSTF